MHEVEILPLDVARFEGLVPIARMQGVEARLAAVRDQLAARVVWHVNSTATGGGVAEILRSVLGYLAGSGIAARWAVLDGDDEFFRVTKRIHNMLHDRPGDGGPLGEEERRMYAAALDDERGELLSRVRPGDVVFLHDPQTLGLAGALRDAGARVVWICHVGVDRPGEISRRASRFLLPYALRAEAIVFTRAQYVWEGLDSVTIEIIPPCIDAFSSKNRALDDATVAEIVGRIGADGRAPIVTQISRWDPLKDHAGVMTAFVEHVPPELGARLVLAGPSPEGVDDDPEGAAVLGDLVARWDRLPPPSKARVHIASLPTRDADENALMVNALQRHAAVVVQKSLAEGFGLTVAEAMWKARPVAASRVGGIQDQIEHGRTGVLIDDPSDLPALGRAVTQLLADVATADRLGRTAHESVADHFLVPAYLDRTMELAQRLL
jgi:trehalose synthase